MNEHELRIYFFQFIFMLIIYVALLLLIFSYNPLHGKISCSYDKCTVENTFVLNYKTTMNFLPDKSAYLMFLGNSSYGTGYVIINIFNHETLMSEDILPFRRTNFYQNNDSSAVYEFKKSMRESFKNYVNNKQDTFVMENDFNRNTLNLLSTVLTMIFMGFALTRRPLSNMFRIIIFMLSGGRMY